MKQRLIMLLSAGALIAGPAAVAVAAPGAAQARAQATPIRHVIVLDMENHTLENLFGFACANGVLRGCPASVAIPSSVRLADGTRVRPSVLPDTVPNVLHSPQSEILGLHNQWDQIPGCGPSTTPAYACIGGYQPSQEPNLIRLAQHFSWSAMTFGALTASWGSHLFTAASTLDRFTGLNPPAVPGAPRKDGWGCDSRRHTTWVPPGANKPIWVPSCVPDPTLKLPHGGASGPTPVSYVPTIFDQLNAAGDSWKIYGAHSGRGGYGWSICPTFAECLDTRQAANLVPTGQFFTDAAAGRLPAYSVVVPGAGYAKDSEHNGQSMTAGDNFLGAVASAVMHDTSQWRSTVLIVTWDDFGGFWGSPAPAPGTNPDGTRLGFRVPVLIISPFAKPGYVDSTPASQASITALAEHVFGLPALSINDRYAYAYDNSLCLPPACVQAPAKPAVMVKRPLPASARHLGNAGAYAAT